jgi:hypothetical protein
LTGEPGPVLPAVPPPRRPKEADRTTLLALAILGLCPLLMFLAPVALVLAQTEIRDLRRRDEPAPYSLRAARAMGLVGTALLVFIVLCWGNHL